MITLKIYQKQTFDIYQKQAFDIIAMTPKGTLGLRCVHIAQLVTHAMVKHYRLPCSYVTSLLAYSRG